MEGYDERDGFLHRHATAASEIQFHEKTSGSNERYREVKEAWRTYLLLYESGCLVR